MKKLTELVKIRELLESVYTTDPIVSAVGTLESDLGTIGNETLLTDVKSDVGQQVGGSSDCAYHA